VGNFTLGSVDFYSRCNRMNVFRSVIESKIGFQFLVAKFDDDKKVYDLTVYDIDEDGTVGNPFPFDMHDLPDLVESVETRLKQS
jgi:hypothetical protein